MSRSPTEARCVVARLQDDVVFLAGALERGDDARAHHGLERAAHGLQRNAEIRRLVAVDLHDDARLALEVVGLEVEDARILGGDALHDLVAPLHDFLVVAAAERDGQRARAVARQRAARLVHVDARAGDALRALAQPVGDLAGALVALIPEIERHDHHAGVHFGAAAEAAGARDHALRIAAAPPRPCATSSTWRSWRSRYCDARAFGRGDEDAHEARDLPAASSSLGSLQPGERQAHDEHQQHHAEQSQRAADDPQRPLAHAATLRSTGA